MTSNRLVVIFFLLAICFGEYCQRDTWTDELCQQCQDTPFASPDGKKCINTDCSKVTKWTNDSCNQCNTVNTWANVAETKCININCNRDNYTEDNCKICYGDNYYPNLDGRRCLTFNCKPYLENHELTNEICSMCYWYPKLPNVSLDRSFCTSNVCDPLNPYSTDSCKNCYKPSLYPMFNSLGCTTIDCRNIHQLTDGTCTQCLGKPAFAMTNQRECKLFPQAYSNFKRINY